MRLTEKDFEELRAKSAEVSEMLKTRLGVEPENIEGALDAISKLTTQAEVAALKNAAECSAPIAKMDIPKLAKQAAMMSILIGGIAGALIPLGMMTASKEQQAKLKEGPGPGSVTRDQLLFAALFAIASENVTDEGKQDMVYMAEAFANGDKDAFPSTTAHKQFELIRGYPYQSADSLMRD